MSTLAAPHPRPFLQRFDALDHMRGFIFLLMALDHAIHAYAAHWGPYAFFRDYDRSYVFDALYLFNQAAIMPVLFFTFGAYVLPKISVYGMKTFWCDKVMKWGLPFIIGIPLVVPLLSYPKYKEFTDTQISYTDYWAHIFFSKGLQAGPYWVMYALALFTSLLLLINKLFPRLVNHLAHWLQRAFTKPTKAILQFIAFSAVIYGLSDLRYGTPWWIGIRDLFPDMMLGKLFSMQGSKFAMNFVYFFMGAVFMRSQVWKNPQIKDLWFSFTAKKYCWLMGTLIFGALYTLYAHSFYYDGAYDDSIYKTIRFNDGSWEAYKAAFYLLGEKAPLVLIRTTILAVLVLMQLLTLLSFFGSKRDTTSQSYRLWTHAAMCCWGIFIIHDPLMIWIQFILVETDMHILGKSVLVMVGGIIPAWVATHYLLKVPYLRRVFQLD